MTSTTSTESHATQIRQQTIERLAKDVFGTVKFKNGETVDMMEIERNINRRQKIALIKYIRQISQLGLKEAKDLFDTEWNSHTDNRSWDGQIIDPSAPAKIFFFFQKLVTERLLREGKNDRFTAFGRIEEFFDRMAELRANTACKNTTHLNWKEWGFSSEIEADNSIWNNFVKQLLTIMPDEIKREIISLTNE